jgi:hypothetical protein
MKYLIWFGSLIGILCVIAFGMACNPVSPKEHLYKVVLAHSYQDTIFEVDTLQNANVPIADGFTITYGSIRYNPVFYMRDSSVMYVCVNLADTLQLIVTKDTIWRM